MKKNKYLVAALFFISLFIISSLSAAQEPDQELNQQPLTFEEQFQNNPTPDNFNQLPNPTAADLVRLGDGATATNFEYLMNKNPTQAAGYLEQRYNNDFAQTFYDNPAHLGLNPALDDKYISGEGNKEQSTQNIEHNSPVAAKYFTNKFGKDVKIEDVPAGFFFDASKNSLILGKSEYPVGTYVNIVGVRVTGTEIILIPAESEEIGEISTTGGKEGKFSYQDGNLIFTDAVGTEQKFSITGVESTKFNFQSDGTLEVQGQVKGIVWTDSNNYVDFTNRVGTLVIKPNGNFEAVNAGILTREIYVDGKVKKEGNLITTQDHGDRGKGNIDVDGRTIFFHRRSRAIVETRGQTGNNNVEIHTDELPQNSDAAKPPPGTPEEARELARNVRVPPKEDTLGGNAVVWIKEDEQGTFLEADGKVKVSFGAIGPNGGVVVNGKMPQATLHSGKSGIKLQFTPDGQRTELFGRLDYSDEQFLASEGQTRGIQTVQDGASLKITRDDGSPIDIIHADCFDCEKGIPALRIQKTIVTGGTTDVPGVLADPEFHSLRIIVRVDDAGKLTYDPATKDLGFLARTQTEDKRIALGRDMVMKIPCGDKECNFQLRKEERLGTAQAFYEEFDGKTTRTVPLDLGIGTVIGEAAIVTSNKNKENLERLMKLVQNKQFQDLQQAKLEFDNDQALRKAVLQRTGLDIDKINDAKYVEKVETVARHHTQAQQGIAQLQKEFGINLDENGRPQSNEDAEKINSFIASRRGKEFDIYTKALENLARANFADNEATLESCRGNAHCSFSQTQLKNAQEEAKKRIVSIVKLRELAYQEAKVQEWKSLQKHKPEGAQNAEANAAKLGRTIRDNEKERLRAESTLWGTRENPGAEARSAAAKQKYEQLREEHLQEIEGARILEEARVGNVRAADVQESTELQAARLEYYQERDTVNSLKKSLHNAQNRELNAQEALGSLAFQFPDRPDVQAGLYHAAGMTAAAANFVAESKSLSDAAKANLFQQFQGYSEAQALDRATFLANLEDDKSAAEAAALLHSLKEKRPDIHVFPEFQRANDALAKTLIRRGEEQEQHLNEQIGRMQEQAHERTASIVEGPNDWDRPGFLGGVDVVGHSVGRALSRWETVLPDVVTLGGYSDAKTEMENNALTELTRQRDLTQQRNKILQAYADRGLSAADAFRDMSRGKYDPGVLRYNPQLEGAQVPLSVDANNLVLNELANGLMPTDTEDGRAALAAAAAQDAENEELFHYGKIAPAEAHWLRVIQEHPDSPQAAIARERLKALDQEIVPGLTQRREETGRDVVISLLTPDAFLGLGVTKTLTTAVKGTRLAAAGEKAVTAGKIAVYGTQETKAALNLARVELKAAEKVKDVAQIERAQAAYRTAREAAEVEAKSAFEAGRIPSLGRQVKITPYRRELAREYNQQAVKFSEETSKLHEARRAGDLDTGARALAAKTEAAAEMERITALDETAKLAGSDARTLWDRTLGKKIFVSDKVKDAEKAFQQAQKAYRDERLVFGEARVSVDTQQNLLRANKNAQQAWASAGNKKLVNVVQQEAGKLPPNEAQELRLLTTKLNQKGALLETKGVAVKYNPQTVPVSAVSDAARAEELAVKIDLGDVVVKVRKEQDALKAFADSEFVAANKQKAAAEGKEIAEVIPLRRKVQEKPGVRSDIVEPCNLAAAAIYGLAPCLAAAHEARLTEVPEEVGSELADIGRLDTNLDNAPSWFEREIQEGRDIERLLDQSPLSEELYLKATQDRYGASKLPVFENRLPDEYILYEISMDRNNLKKLNSFGYEIGTEAISSQHQELIKFAKENNLPVTTLQKTTYIAIPKGSAVKTDDVLAAIEKAQEATSKTTSQAINLRVGIADSADSLLETRLRTKRSLEFSSKTAAPPTKYGDNVKTWFDDLSLEERANVNDLFQGYDPRLKQEFAGLDSSRKLEDLDAYQKKLSQLAVVDLQDARFNNLQTVKSYQSDLVTGVKPGDLVASTDGIKLGQANKDDVLQLTRQNLPDGQLANQLGKNIDEKIISVNEKIKQTYFDAVDNVRPQPKKVIDKYSEIANAAGYGKPIRNTDEVKNFLKWEFENKGRFRGGDESFQTFRKEVVDANPQLTKNLQDSIKDCSTCGYEIRVGVAEVAPGEKYIDAITKSDKATILSKELGDVPIRIDASGNKVVSRLDVDNFEIVGNKVFMDGTELSDEAADIVRSGKAERAEFENAFEQLGREAALDLQRQYGLAIDARGRLILPEEQIQVHGKYAVKVKEEGTLVTALRVNREGRLTFITYSKNNKIVINAPESLEKIVNTINTPADLERNLERLLSDLEFRGYQEWDNLPAGISDQDVLLLFRRCLECFTLVDKKVWQIKDLGVRVKLGDEGFEGIGKGYRHLEKHSSDFDGVVDSAFESFREKTGFEITSGKNKVRIVRYEGDKLAVMVTDQEGNIVTLYSSFEESRHIDEITRTEKSVLETLERPARNGQAKIYSSKDGKELLVHYEGTDVGMRYRKNGMIKVEGVKVTPKDINPAVVGDPLSKKKSDKIFTEFKKGFADEQIEVDLSKLIGPDEASKNALLPAAE